MGILGLTFILSVVIFIISLFNPQIEIFSPVVDLPIKIYEKALVELNAGIQNEVIIDNAFVSFNYSDTKGSISILNFLYSSVFIGIGFYIVFLFWKIFRSIKSSLKSENLFLYKNIWRIRLIAISVFSYSLLELLYPVILKLFWFKKIILFNKPFDISIDFDSSINMFWALIIFVVAEIYRIGLEIKKDQELTI